MKVCKTCLVQKLYSDFFKDKGLKDGHSNTCKVCKTKKTYAWREKNLELYNRTMREYQKQHYDAFRLHRYDLSREDYNKILESQKEVCAICSKPNPSKKRSLAVDHNPHTEEVRGILCYGCNRAIAIFDDAKLLASAQKYLTDPPARAILGKPKRSGKKPHDQTQ